MTFRIDWIDSASGDACMELVNESEIYGILTNYDADEIISITAILDEEGNESENLLEYFLKKIEKRA